MNLKGKKLLVLTGCNGAKDIINYANSQEVYTIATDYYKNSITKKLANVSYDVSTTDIDSLLKIAKKENIDGIMTGASETSIRSILEISEALNLPFYTTKEKLDKINNKKKFKNILKKFDVPVVEEFYLTKEMIKNQNFKNVEFPVVVKPVDSSGGKGISVCENSEELDSAYKFALKYSDSKDILFEKYLSGMQEVFINYTIVDGKFSLSCAFDKNVTFKQDDFPGLPIAYIFPSDKLKTYINKAHSNLISALKHINIKNGTISIQCFYDGDNFYVYEGGYRIGGGQSYIFTDKLNNINALEMMTNHSLTSKMTDDLSILNNDDPYFEKPCCQINIPLKPGEITVLDGVSKIKECDKVLNVTEVHKKGDVIKKDGSVNQLGLRIHVMGDSMYDLKKLINYIYATIIIKDEKGIDMILDKYNF